jgi:hypothetical protein
MDGKVHLTVHSVFESLFFFRWLTRRPGRDARRTAGRTDQVPSAPVRPSESLVSEGCG